MWITYFPPEDYLKHYRIPVPYMKETAIAILEWYSNKAMPLKTLTQDGDSQTQEEIVF